jgi:carbonic anhydrase/acetyltransferase-like protein (isoleucine patch superfamily)
MPVLEYSGVWPKLGERVFIAPNATVIGDVHIGDESSIWFGTVVRGDVFHIRIGRRTNIQDNSVIHVTTGQHATIVGDNVVVGHRVILHGCTIEDNVLIGMGAIVMDRAVIGKGSLVGAGALVTEGTVIPPGMLALGSPAKAKRPLNDAEKEHVLRASEGYAMLAQQYAASIGFGIRNG